MGSIRRLGKERFEPRSFVNAAMNTALHRSWNVLDKQLNKFTKLSVPLTKTSAWCGDKCRGLKVEQLHVLNLSCHQPVCSALQFDAINRDIKIQTRSASTIMHQAEVGSTGVYSTFINTGALKSRSRLKAKTALFVTNCSFVTNRQQKVTA